MVQAVRESPLQLQARVEGKEVHVPLPRCVCVWGGGPGGGGGACIMCYPAWMLLGGWRPSPP